MGLKDLVPSIQALVFGIEWLIVGKFVENENTKNILQDLLGDGMSMVHEYAENKAKKAEERIIKNQLKSGMEPKIIASTAEIPLSRVQAIKRNHVENESTRYILQDLLAGGMSMVREYAENKAKNAEEKIVRNQLKSGMGAEIIASTAEIPLSRVQAIKRKYNL